MLNLVKRMWKTVQKSKVEVKVIEILKEMF